MKGELLTKVINFLFKCLERYGRNSSVLFSVIDFGKVKNEVVDRLLRDYSNEFDFNMINSTMSETILDMSSSMIKQREEYSRLFEQMSEKLKEEEANNKEMMRQFVEEISKIKESIENKMTNIEKKFASICKRQEDIIEHGNVLKYHKVVLNILSFEQFELLDEELKSHIISEVIKHPNVEQNGKNYLISAISLLNIVHDHISYENESEREKGAIQFIKDNLAHPKKLSMKPETISALHCRGLMQSFLLKYFPDDFEVEYPCDDLDGMLKSISDIKATRMKDGSSMRVSLSVNKEEFYESKHQTVKCIDELTFGSEVKIIKSGSFEGCESLVKVIIPESIEKIENNAFEGCTKLNEIYIDSFGMNIEKNTFDCKSLNQIYTLNAKDIQQNKSVIIPSKATEVFFEMGILQKPKFASSVKKYSEVIIEINSSSSNFMKIEELLVHMRESNSSKLKISIVLSGGVNH